MDRFFRNVGDRFRGLREREPVTSDTTAERVVVASEKDEGVVAGSTMTTFSTTGEESDGATEPESDDGVNDGTSDADVTLYDENGEVISDDDSSTDDAAASSDDSEDGADSESNDEEDPPTITAYGEREFGAADQDSGEFTFSSGDDEDAGTITSGEDESTFTLSGDDEEDDGIDGTGDITFGTGSDNSGTITVDSGSVVRISDGTDSVTIDSGSDSDEDDAIDGSGDFSIGTDSDSEFGVSDGSDSSDDSFVIGVDGEGDDEIVAADDGGDDDSSETTPEPDLPMPDPEEEPDPEGQIVVSVDFEPMPGYALDPVAEASSGSDGSGQTNPYLEAVLERDQLAGIDYLDGARISLADDDDDEELTVDDLIEKPSKPENQPEPGTIPSAPELAGAGSATAGQPSGDLSHLAPAASSDTDNGSSSPAPADYQLAEDPRLANIEYHGDLIVAEDDGAVPADDGIERPNVENERAPGEGPSQAPGPKAADLDVINTTAMAGDSEAGEPSLVIDQNVLAGDADASEPTKSVDGAVTTSGDPDAGNPVDLASSGDADAGPPLKIAESQESVPLEFVQAPGTTTTQATIDFATQPVAEEQPMPINAELSVPVVPVDPAPEVQSVDLQVAAQIEPIPAVDPSTDDEDDPGDGE